MDPGTYVYCLVAGEREPSLSRVAKGLQGVGPVRLLPVKLAPAKDRRGGQWLVVGSAPLDRFGEAPLNKKMSDLEWVSKAAMAHEAVVESFSAMTSVLPMKLFTIFDTDERARGNVEQDGRRIGRLLTRLANRDEWGVRVLLDRARAASGSARRSSPIRTGAEYLAAKKARQDQATELAAHAQDTVTTLYRSLGEHADASTRRAAGDWPAQGHSLLLDAAFLVRRTRLRAFRSLVARHARQLDPKGYIVDLTGPWPPYSFLQD
jgi:hypothetical protein